MNIQGVKLLTAFAWTITLLLFLFLTITPQEIYLSPGESADKTLITAFVAVLFISMAGNIVIRIMKRKLEKNRRKKKNR